MWDLGWQAKESHPPCTLVWEVRDFKAHGSQIFS